jgi:hypothetical protein
MLTKEQVLDEVKSKKLTSGCIDGRDFARLTEWFELSEWTHFGFALKEGADPTPVKPWTEESVVEQLRRDTLFGFEKACDERGISSSFMYETVKMWLHILDDDTAATVGYGSYGMPLFRAVAQKYGFNLNDE